MKKQTYTRSFTYFFMTVLGLALSLSACKKAKEIPVDPYAGGKEALGVRFLTNSPLVEGNAVTFSATGLLPYKDQLHLLINNMETQVTEITNNSITVTLPNNVSSGSAVIIIKDQIFFGPMVPVGGKTELDAAFEPVGANGSINQIFPMPNGNLLLVGGFTNYGNMASATRFTNGIVTTTANGRYINGLNAQKGASGTLTSILKLNNGQYMVGGVFYAYNDRKSINGITRLNTNGSLDTSIVELVNLTPEEPKNAYDTVAKFNGGVTGIVNKVYLHNNQLILQGSFSNYGEYFYERSTRDRKLIEFTKVNNLLRMSLDGKMDSTYNWDYAAKKPLEAGNGSVNGSVMLADGSLLLVGGFTRYQAQAANYIVKINPQGKVDGTFNASANGSIYSIRYNSNTGKYMLAGAFTQYNNVAVNGMVRINADGSIDPTFTALGMGSGFPTFAAQLSNGKIIVAGTFGYYNNIVRQGFMILNADGTLAEGYNNTGTFSGFISDIYESTNNLGYTTVILAGNIFTFDTKRVNNIIRIVLKP